MKDLYYFNMYGSSKNYEFEYIATSFLMCKTCKHFKKLLKDDCGCHIVRTDRQWSAYTSEVILTAICENKDNKTLHQEIRKINRLQWAKCDGRLDKFIEEVLKDGEEKRV